MIEQLLADLAYMALCWGLGLFTGLGIGVALGLDRMNRMWLKDLMEEDVAA